MSSLALIGEYSSDSDELDNNKEDSKVRLPVPRSIKVFHGELHHPDVVDDSSNHQGRIRSFKHERGNWPSLVYINYIPSDDLLNWIKSAVTLLPDIDNNCLEELHISLSRTLILKYHWIDPFVESLKAICQRTPSFNLKIYNLQVYCNEEKTRTFLGLECYNDDMTVEIFLRELDKLLAEYDLPLYFEDPSIHISFVWTLGDKERVFNAALPSLMASFNKFLSECDNVILVHYISCKIGNKMYKFELK